jgi:uncharacterized protein YegJ (DUF2314 family)
MLRAMKPLLIALVVLAAIWLLWRRFAQPAGIAFDLDDADMATAKQQARDSLPEFWAAFEAAAPGDTDFGLKFDLNHGLGLPDRELIWAMAIARADDGSIQGQLANPPRNRDFAAGQSVIIAPDAIVDWCFFRNNVAHGHHITRLMIERSPPRRAAQARQQLGW